MPHRIGQDERSNLLNGCQRRVKGSSAYPLSIPWDGSPTGSAPTGRPFTIIRFICWRALWISNALKAPLTGRPTGSASDARMAVSIIAARQSCATSAHSFNHPYCLSSRSVAGPGTKPYSLTRAEWLIPERRCDFGEIVRSIQIKGRFGQINEHCIPLMLVQNTFCSALPAQLQ